MSRRRRDPLDELYDILGQASAQVFSAFFNVLADRLLGIPPQGPDYDVRANPTGKMGGPAKRVRSRQVRTPELERLYLACRVIGLPYGPIQARTTAVKTVRARKLALNRRWHPDRKPGPEALKRIQAINDAADTILKYLEPKTA